MAIFKRLNLVICGVLCAFVVSAVAQPPDDTRPLTLGFYLVIDCTSASASAPMQIAGAPEQYCLARTPLIDQRDIASADFANSAKDMPLKLTLRGAAAQRWFEVTGNHIGSKIAEVLDGRLIFVAEIKGPTQNAWVNGLNRTEAESLTAAIARGDVAPAGPAALPPGVGPGEADAHGIFKAGHGVSPPIPIQKSAPEYTAEARAARIEGIVIVEAVIEPDGTPDMLRVVRSLDPGLDAKAMEAVRTWRFRPAMKDGNAVPVRITIEMNFRLG